MLAQRSAGSYSAKKVEKQERMRAGEVIPSPERLLTDRTSYIAYLESQLERVSAACLTAQSFDCWVEEAVSGIRLLEEKTLNLARLISTTQQFAEQQESAQREATAEVCRRLRAVEARLNALEEPGRVAEWETKLRAVSARVDSQLEQMQATAEARLKDVASGLQAGLEEACHSSHLQLDRRIGEAAGRLAEVERRVRAVDEYAHQADHGAAVADLAKRLGSVEDSLAHLAKSDSGMKSTLGSLHAAVGQLKTAVVALELRPPLGAAATSGADCLQWLERAREALKREVADIQHQHGQLAVGLHSAAATAAAAPQSPQKVLAAQVLSGLQSSMQAEVGKEVQALQLADQMLAHVASNFSEAPNDVRTGTAAGQRSQKPGECADVEAASLRAGGKPQGEAAPASKAASVATSAAGADGGSGEWMIAAVPSACSGAASPSPASQHHLAYPQAPPAQQAVSAATDSALAQLQQLAGREQQFAQAAALAAKSSNSGVGSSNLRNTFGQMQQMLQSVCQLLQQDGASQQQQQRQQQRFMEPGYQAAASRHLSQSSTLLKGSSSIGGTAGQTRPMWVPGGSSKPVGARAPVPAASHLLSYRSGGAAGAQCGGGSGSGGSKEALRESVLGQKALAERRKRLQQLYDELKTGS